MHLYLQIMRSPRLARAAAVSWGILPTSGAFDSRPWLLLRAGRQAAGEKPRAGVRFLFQRVNEQRGLAREVQRANEVVGLERALRLFQKHLRVVEGFLFQIAQPDLFQLSDSAPDPCLNPQDLLSQGGLLRGAFAWFESGNFSRRRLDGIFSRFDGGALGRYRASSPPNGFLFRRLFLRDDFGGFGR